MAKKPKYASHPYLNGLMTRTLAEKKLRPELIESVARTMDARCNEIRIAADLRNSRNREKALKLAMQHAAKDGAK